jgi:Caspase domain
MTRKALLIGGPGTKGSSDYLPGVQLDLDHYSAFLQSSLGGAWRRDEITTLMSPSEFAVRSGVAELKSADYSFVLFSGHGYYSSSSSSTIVALRDNVELDSSVLRVGASKHTLLLDCCRVEWPSATTAADSLAKAIRESISLDATECRKYYDERIRECPSGIVVLHSCAINETSGDRSDLGGVYSANVIKGAEQWSRNDRFDTSENYYIRDVPAAHEAALPAVKQLSGGRQNSQIEKPRSGKYFPFAIVA